MTRRADAAAPPPSIDPAAWRFVSAAAAHGLEGAPPFPTPPAGELAWTRTVKLAEEQRVVGLLAAAAADGAVELEGAAFDHLAEVHEAWCAHDLRLERALVRAADALDAAALPYLVLKGAALAHRWYPDPAQRLFADLDIVVPSGRVRDASRILADLLGTTPRDRRGRPRRRPAPRTGLPPRQPRTEARPPRPRQRLRDPRLRRARRALRRPPRDPLGRRRDH